MRTIDDSNLQLEWSRLTYDEKVERLKQTTIKRKELYPTYDSKGGVIVKTIDGYLRFKQRIR